MKIRLFLTKNSILINIKVSQNFENSASRSRKGRSERESTKSLIKKTNFFMEGKLVFRWFFSGRLIVHQKNGEFSINSILPRILFLLVEVRSVFSYSSCSCERWNGLMSLFCLQMTTFCLLCQQTYLLARSKIRLFVVITLWF